MITKLKEDYMVSGMVYKRVTNTPEIKMVYLDINIEKMTIGYKPHHLELVYTNQYGFKQVYSYETILPYDKLKIKQGFKITCLDNILEMYSGSSKEYEIWLQALKDYFEKKLRREKQLAKEEIELKLKIGTDIRTFDKFDAKVEFNNWEFEDEDEFYKVKKVTPNVSFDEEESIHQVIIDKKPYTGLQIDTFELKRYRDPSYKIVWVITRPIYFTLDKKQHRPDLYRVNHEVNYNFTGKPKINKIIHEHDGIIPKRKFKLEKEQSEIEIYIKAHPKKRVLESNHFEYTKIKPPNKISRQNNLMIEIDKTEKVIKPHRDSRFEFIYRRFLGIRPEFHDISFTIYPTEKVIEFARQDLYNEYLRKPLITKFEKTTHCYIAATPKIFESSLQTSFTKIRKYQPLIFEHLENVMLYPTKKIFELEYNSLFVPKRTYHLVKFQVENINIHPTKQILKIINDHITFHKSNFKTLVPITVEQFRFYAIAPIFSSVKDELHYHKTNFLILAKINVESITLNYVKSYDGVIKRDYAVHTYKMVSNSVFYPKGNFITLSVCNSEFIKLVSARLPLYTTNVAIHYPKTNFLTLAKSELHIINLITIGKKPFLTEIQTQITFPRKLQPLSKSLIELFQIQASRRNIIKYSPAQSTEFIINRSFILSLYSNVLTIQLNGKVKVPWAMVKNSLNIAKLEWKLFKSNAERFELINNIYKKQQLEFDSGRNDVLTIISTNKKHRKIVDFEDKLFYDNKEDPKSFALDSYSSNDRTTVLIKQKKEFRFEQEQKLKSLHFDSEEEETMGKKPKFGGISFVAQRYKFRNNKINDIIMKIDRDL